MEGGREGGREGRRRWRRDEKAQTHLCIYTLPISQNKPYTHACIPTINKASQHSNINKILQIQTNNSLDTYGKFLRT